MLGTILSFIDWFEIHNLLLLICQACCNHCLHSHVLILHLHLHVLIRNHPLMELLILRILPLRVLHKHIQILMIHIHILLIWHLVLHHNTLKLIHIIRIIHINLRGHWHLHTIHYSYSSYHFIGWFRNRSSRISQFMISMSIWTLICISALSM
jgi:hypothetical protein